VIDDQVDWAKGVDLGRVAAETLHSVTHGSKIDNSGYTSEVLKDNSGGAERNLSVVLRRLFPVEDGLDVLLLYGEVVTVTDGTLQEDADRVRQRLDAGISQCGEFVEVVFGTTMF